jgi:hypothetical protein
MSALDDFIEELRAVAPADFPELERLESAFRNLQVSSDPAMIDECDRLTALAGQPITLIERIYQILLLMQGRQPR